VAVIATTSLTLTACADQPDTADGSGSGTSETVADFGAGDVMFAQMMIPHHEQAIEMADMALERTENADIRTLATEIKDAQDPEIATMTGWLEAAGEDVPGMDGMAGMDHSGMGHSGMAGMMSEEDMAALDAASGEEFDRMWLEMMIEHHEGAVVMAEEVLDTTSNPEVEALATAVVEGQTAEIAQMQELLGS
jgi:uncharacterized protein (DUF305 family)